jgi:hypothetical protein
MRAYTSHRWSHQLVPISWIGQPWSQCGVKRNARFVLLIENMRMNISGRCSSLVSSNNLTSQCSLKRNTGFAPLIKSVLMDVYSMCSTLVSSNPLLKLLWLSSASHIWMIIFLKDGESHVDPEVSYALGRCVFICLSARFGVRIPL